MCPFQKHGQAQQVNKGATLVGTLHLLCVFCAILHCACGNVDHDDHHHHLHLHEHRSNSTTVPPHHPPHQSSSAAHSPSTTSKSELKGNPNNTDSSQKQASLSDYEQRRLHRFNQRFPSMRQCQLSSSGCECLWSAKHLRGMLQVERSDQQTNNDTDQNNYRLNDEGASTTEGKKVDDTVLTRQMAVIMMTNVLQLGKLGDFSQNDWFKCTAKASICEKRQSQSYRLSRVHLLSTLMPNMAFSGDHLRRQSSNSEDHHHHHHNQHSEELLSSIELFTDIESLLRQINHLLAIDQQANDAGDDDQKKKCFDREDLLEDYQQQVAEATSAKTADHHDHPQREENEAPVTAENLLYIEHLTNIIVNRLASGECIELFETKFLRDIISRYGTAQLTENSSQQLNSSRGNNNQSTTVLAIHQEGFVKLLNDLHIGGLIEANSTAYSNTSSAAERRVDGEDDHPNDHDVAHHRHDHSSSPVAYQSHNEAVAAAAALSTEAVIKCQLSWSSINHQCVTHCESQSHWSSTRTLPQLSAAAAAAANSAATPQKARSSAACLDYHYYLHRQGLSGADNKKKLLTAADLRELSPIFIQQILSGACEQLEPGEHIVSRVPTTKTILTASKMLQEGSMDAADNLLSLSSSSPHQHFDATGEEVWKIYVYSGISVAIISVSSICGVLMIPFLKSTYYTHIINLLIGLAFSSMAGDALLHLLPTVLGIHSHSHSEGNGEEDGHNHSHGSVNADAHQHDHSPHHHHDHEENPSAINYMGLMIAIMATVYALFLFEVVSNFFASKRAGGGGGGHGHSHGHSHQQPIFPKSTEAAKSENQLDTPTLTKITATDNSDQQATYSSSSTIASILTNTDQEAVMHAHHRHPHNHHDDHHHYQHSEEQLYKSSSAAAESQAKAVCRTANETVPLKENANMPVLLGLTSLALIITIGDSIHNLLDGVAIGIAFSNSIASGISTSIAVLFHELPHEFGDFAVLLSTGLSVRRAALINFLSALTAFIGLYIGILLGNNEEANRWALAICAGLFLYVALVDMLPELKEMPSTEGGSTTWVISLLVKNVGILMGAGFMIALSKYEDLLKFA